MRNKYSILLILVVAILLAFFVYPQGFNKGADYLNGRFGLTTKKFKIPHFFSVPDFRLGLDLLGGTHLVYKADLSTIGGQDAGDAMAGVRDVIERRVNLFGVSEPLVQIEGSDRLIVELAGISDVNQAIAVIGQTPFLEFKEELPRDKGDKIIADFVATLPKDQQENFKDLKAEALCNVINFETFNIFLLQFQIDPCFSATGLSGKHLKRSEVVFDPTTNQPQVSLGLNDEGAKIFADITKRNVGKPLAIYIDGTPITYPPPIVQTEITSGDAVINGDFTIKYAKDMTNRLNAGALPVHIEPISQQTIGPSLGAESLRQSLRAALFGFLAVAVFMIAYYRLPGLVAVIALVIYVIIVLAIYKVIPVTLTLAGIAGFVLSLGIAVDANVLIFARMREELKAGRTLSQAFHEGFRRAWLSIRDSHVTTLLGALILYMFTTSIVKGFALTLGIGVLLSLVTSIIITRSLLRAFLGDWFEKHRGLF